MYTFNMDKNNVPSDGQNCTELEKRLVKLGQSFDIVKERMNNATSGEIGTDPETPRKPTNLTIDLTTNAPQRSANYRKFTLYCVNKSAKRQEISRLLQKLSKKIEQSEVESPRNSSIVEEEDKALEGQNEGSKCDMYKERLTKDIFKNFEYDTTPTAAANNKVNNREKIMITQQDDGVRKLCETKTNQTVESEAGGSGTMEASMEKCRSVARSILETVKQTNTTGKEGMKGIFRELFERKIEHTVSEYTGHFNAKEHLLELIRRTLTSKSESDFEVSHSRAYQTTSGDADKSSNSLKLVKYFLAEIIKKLRKDLNVVKKSDGHPYKE